MHHHTAAIETLQRSGHRLTPQRMMVLDALEELGGHETVERIHERVCEHFPSIDIATVYRTVGLLARLHILNEVVQGGTSRYELVDPNNPHHHMVCEHCGRTFHLPAEYLESLRKRLIRDTGFEPHMEHFTISGLCAECRADEEHAHNGHSHAHGASQPHTHPRQEEKEKAV